MASTATTGRELLLSDEAQLVADHCMRLASRYLLIADDPSIDSRDRAIARILAEFRGNRGRFFSAWAAAAEIDEADDVLRLEAELATA